MIGQGRDDFGNFQTSPTRPRLGSDFGNFEGGTHHFSNVGEDDFGNFERGTHHLGRREEDDFCNFEGGTRHLGMWGRRL